MLGHAPRDTAYHVRSQHELEYGFGNHNWYGKHFYVCMERRSESLGIHHTDTHSRRFSWLHQSSVDYRFNSQHFSQSHVQCSQKGTGRKAAQPLCATSSDCTHLKVYYCGQHLSDRQPIPSTLGVRAGNQLFARH